MSTSAAAAYDLRFPELSPAGRQTSRCVIVSDRLPIELTREEGKGWRLSPSGSALVSALKPVLRERRGVWVGWPGVATEEVRGLRKVLTGFIDEGGFSLRPVPLSARERRLCYGGFAGEVLWPLFHDLPPESGFRPDYWQAFLRVNRKFARATAKALARGAAGDLVWVNDHLLMNLAAELRRLGVSCRKAFFVHLPFPAPDLFRKLPWRERLLAGLLAFDQLGFQTTADLANFLACVRVLAPDVREGEGGGSLRGTMAGISVDLRTGVFPIGIDARRTAERAARPEVEARMAVLRAALRGRRMVFGVDGLDRAKGIPEKLRAFAEALTRYPELQERIVLVQVAVPGPEGGPRHAILRGEIERLVGEINGAFGRPGWVPVQYHHRALDRVDLLAHYRVADVTLLTPLKAGMHLGAKELCAANLEERCALVLSEFAGAAAQLADGALLVNPCDVEGTARALRQALRLTPGERRRRMRRMREEVRRHDVSWWAGSFLAAVLADRPGDAPAASDSVRNLGIQ